MQPSARDVYLETQVMTANPFKLRLMLVEGAIRFVNQTLHLWDEGRDEDALESTIRAREILSELMTSLDPQRSELAAGLLPIYSYVFRTLTEGQWEKDRGKLADALRVLGEERITWQQVCEKFAEEADSLRAAPPEEVTAASAATAVPAKATPAPSAPTVAPRPLSFDSSALGMAPAGGSAPTAARGFSFEA